jgi:hypothetical protein
MNLPKEPITEATSKLFELRTPVATTIMELILLLILVGGAGYLYERGPAVLKVPAALFMIFGTLVGLFLFLMVIIKSLSKPSV